jgi:predicted nucleic acid-binding Zn finger protein
MDVDTVWKELKNQKALTPGLRQQIISLFSRRGKLALEAIDEGRVKKYLDFYVVTGTSGEYIVDEGFCTCRDFIFRGGRCWHLLAVEIARITGSYEKINLWYQDVWADKNANYKQYLSFEIE